MRGFTLNIVFLIATFCSGQPLAKFAFDENTGDALTIDSVSNLNFNVVNHFNVPERIKGVKGNALRLDGYSTWASRSDFSLSDVKNTLSIEVWFTTEAFSHGTASIVNQQDGTSGFSLSVSAFGELILECFANDKKLEFKSLKRLESYTWNHIVATIDLPSKSLDIFVNCEHWGHKEIDVFDLINLSDTTFFIGRSLEQSYFDNYPLNVLNGAIDELSFYDRKLEQEEINAHCMRYYDSVPNLNIDSKFRHQTDYLRPQYHPMPNTGWANENYGVLYYNGRYHMFFQKNPNFPALFYMHWGHMSSPDLVQWREEKIPLRSSQNFDSFGTWSGTAILDDQNIPRIYYTGVDGAKAGIGEASMDTVNSGIWIKALDNPVFSSPPGGYYHMDFRDPFVWKDKNTYYMIVGSGIKNNGGGILFSYKSTDLIHWRIIDPIFKRSDVVETGIFWEMPSMTKVGDEEYMLCVTPVPLAGKNAEAIYWIGDFKNDRFVPFIETPKKFELINGNLLSPAIGIEPDGTIYYSGIIPEARSVEDQKKAGWRHTFSIVRSLRLLSDKTTIGHIPHPNLCRLRGENIQVLDRVINPQTKFNLPEVRSSQLELDFQLDISIAKRFEIHLLKANDESELTSLVFDVENAIIGLDTRKSTSSVAEKNYEEAKYYFDKGQVLKVHVFIDHSIIEVFINQLVVFSFRAYPSSPESKMIDIVSDEGQVIIKELNLWNLKDMDTVLENNVCIPDNLPDIIRTTFVKKVNNTSVKKFDIYPVPAKDELYVKKIDGNCKSFSYKFYDMTGTNVLNGILNEPFTSLPIGHIESGSYILKIICDGRNEVFNVQKIY